MYSRNGLGSLPAVSTALQKGFTFMEFALALVMAAIIVSLAVPSLVDFSARNKVINTNNSIVTGLNMARSAAITRGDDIAICPSTDGVNCSDDAWDKGWIVYGDADGDGAADAAEVLRVVTIDGDVTHSGFGQQVVFRPDGTTSLGANATITTCFKQDGYNEVCRDVRISQFGLVESAETEKGDEDGEGTPQTPEPS